MTKVYNKRYLDMGNVCKKLQDFYNDYEVLSYNILWDKLYCEWELIIVYKIKE